MSSRGPERRCKLGKMKDRIMIRGPSEIGNELLEVLGFDLLDRSNLTLTSKAFCL